MSRRINLADQKGRNTEITFAGFTKKPFVKTVTKEGKPVHTLRVLKAPVACSFEALMKRCGDPEKIAEALLREDLEIDLLQCGRFIDNVSRLYLDKNQKPVFKVVRTEKVFLPDGTLKEERSVKESLSNVLLENPVRMSGKLIPKKDVIQKIVLSKKYQLSHSNGLTFEFLFNIAKELEASNSLMLVGAGAKGLEPLVFQDGGKAYRAFLEGRIHGDKYCLIMHLSNLELKSIL
jgi:hypothetical protein